MTAVNWLLMTLLSNQDGHLQVFGPAFRRNARWSVATPAPAFGDEETSWNDVEQFYDFWFQFKSWREFPHPDEEDLEHAESREERRYRILQHGIC